MAEEIKVGLFGHLKAGRAHGEALATAEREAANSAKNAPKLQVDTAALTKSAKDAVTAERAAMEKVAQSAGKDLPFLQKTMFNIGKSAPVRLIARNPKKFIALGVAALATLTYTMRSKRKELPSQADLTPLDALAAPESGPADGRSPTEWRDKARPGQQQVSGPNQPAIAGAQDLTATR